MTVAVAWLVCAVVIVAGLTDTETEVTCGDGMLCVPLLPHPNAVTTASTAAHTPTDQRIARITPGPSVPKTILWSIVRVPLHASMCPSRPL